MKVITTVTAKPKGEKWGEFMEKCKTLAELSNREWPESHFSVLSTRSGPRRIVWVEQQPSLAAKEQWEESRFEVAEYGQLLGEIMPLVDGDIHVADFQLHE